jgi:DNA-binding response OmpR family regulator
VLVVDDYRTLCEMIAGMLRPRGYRVLTAVSGEEAKALARANPKIDLLLTDIEMPHMRGDELAAWFRAVKSETRILFMSGQSTVRGSDPTHFLPKPFRAEALVSKVRELLNHNPVPSIETAIP